MLKESQLVERINAGDEAYFKLVFDTYYDRVCSFTKEFVSEEVITEEIAQGVFIKLWEGRKRLSPDSNLMGWLFTVAKNDCLKYLRQLKKERVLDFSSEELISIKALESFDTSNLNLLELHRLIKASIEELPPRCREVFELSRKAELKNREIAEQLGISEKMVEAHISKALKVFRSNLKDYLPLLAILLMTIE
jgi:RNA polymerase sigma-70 factor (ECF subfamily)